MKSSPAADTSGSRGNEPAHIEHTMSTAKKTQMRFTSPFLVVLITLRATSAVYAAPDPVPGKAYFINLASDARGTETHFRYELRSAGARRQSTRSFCMRVRRNYCEWSSRTPDGVTIVTETNGIIRIEMASMADYDTKIITLSCQAPDGRRVQPPTTSWRARLHSLTRRPTARFALRIRWH